MGASGDQQDNMYRLVADARGEAGEHFVEFEATGRHAVFPVAERHFANQNTTLFDNGHALCRLFTPANGGYWVISRVPGEPARS